MRAAIHAGVGVAAMVTIASFWIATFSVELGGEPAAVASVKRAILYGLGLLIPLMAATGISGARLSRGRSNELLVGKRRRMALLAANGLLLMVPMAIFLDAKASAAEFDTLFYAVQLMELLVGLLQLGLLGMNLRAGRRLAGR